MADVNISKYRASVVRDGSKPASPGFVVSEGQDPVNPPGTNNFVPYTGATANVELGEFGVEAGFVTLDTTPTNIPTDQGAIYWDDTRSTAALIMNGTLQHIGQDSFFYVKNSSGSTIPKGTCVGFAGTEGGSGHLLITPFLANGSVPSTYFMGVTCESISNGSFGQVMHFGELEGINTSGFTAGALLYASSTVAGGFQTTAPVAPNNIILVAAAVNSKNNGAIVVRPTLGSNINSDEGVKITSPTTGDLLQLQAGGLWENKTLAQVIGSAYVPSTRTLTINGTALDLSVDRSWSVGDMLLNTYQVVTGTKVFGTNRLIMEGEGTAQPTSLSNTQQSNSALSSHNSFGFNGSNNIYFNKGTTANGGIFAFSNTATRTYTLKDASGTLAFTSDIPSLSGYVQGSGTTNYLPKFTGSTTIGNSQIFDNGNGGILIGKTSSLFGTVNRMSLEISGVVDSLISFFTGTTLNGYLFHNGTNMELLNNRNGSLIFYTNGNPNATLTSGGNLLVGTTTDNGARLQVSGFARFDRGTLQFTLNPSYAGGNVYSQLQSTGALALATGGDNNRLYIDTSGNVGIGTTSPTNSRLLVAGTHVAGNSILGVVPIGDQVATIGVYNSLGVRKGLFYSNTGFVRVESDADPIQIAPAGTVLITATTGGNVGIGTSSPGQLLTLSSANTLGTAINIINTSSGGYNWNIFSGGSDATLGPVGSLIFRDSTNGQSRMLITSGGNVLIGTTTDVGSPYRLQVNGRIQTNGAELIFSGDENKSINVFSNRSLSLSTNDTARLTITGSGLVGIGTTIPGYRLHVRNSDVNEGTIAIGHDNFPGLIYSSASTGEFRIDNRSSAAAGYITFFPNGQQNTLGNEAMRIATSRNVLIGTTTDSGQRLQVNGNVFINGFTSNALTNHGERFIPLGGPNSSFSFNVATQFPSLAISGNVLGVRMFLTIFGSGGSVYSAIATISRNAGGTWSSYGLTGITSTASLLQSITGSGTTITINTNSGSYVGLTATAIIQ